MPRAEFSRDLRVLQDELLVLANMVEKAIARSLDALKNRDLALSEEVVRDDDVIDRKRMELEERCIDLIATQQPLAGDLRVLITVLHMSVELERMGDYAEGIAKISPDDGQRAAAQAADRHTAYGGQGDRHAAPQPRRVRQTETWSWPTPCATTTTRLTRCTSRCTGSF